MFLHGYLSSGRSFSYQLKFFARDFETFAPDLKGFGSNAGMEYPFSLSDYAEEVREYMQKNGIVKPHVIAHSFGARIAIKLAAEDHELFDSIVLTGAAGLKPKRGVIKRIKALEFAVLKKFVKKERLARFYSPDYLKLDDVMKKSFVKIVNENLDGLLPGIKNRTFIVFGEKDKETPPYMAKRLYKGIKNSKLLFIKDAGHFAFIDKPHTFDMEVREFLLG